MPETRYRGVIFDLDGTLIDSMGDIAAATNRTLQKHGFPEHPVDSFRFFIGDGVRKLIVRALPETHREDEPTIAACLACYGEDYGVNWNVQTCLYPGIAETLESLAEMGLKLAVLSNKPDEFTQSCAAHYLKPWRFDTIMGASPRFPHKPDPAAACHIADTWGLRPEQCLYVGDMQVDMQTARNAGMRAIGVTWGMRTREELLAAGADDVIDTPAQLLSLAK